VICNNSAVSKSASLGYNRALMNHPSRNSNVRRAALALLAMLCVATVARAELVGLNEDTVALQTTQFVRQASLETSEFDVVKPGAYRVTLTDFVFPQGFDELSVQITDAAAAFYLAQIEAGLEPSQVITIDQPGAYVASVFASLDSGGGPGYGLYGLRVQLVPVPGAMWLFTSGIILLGGVWRRRGPVAAAHHSALR
jgi:hypothetical protein